MNGLRRRGFLALAGAILPLAARAEAAGPVQAPIAALYVALEAQMRAGQATPFRQRFHALAPVIDQVFDLDTILRVTVGLRWHALDAKSQAELSNAFRRFTIASYVANFDKYENERFEILPALRASGEDRFVQTRIIAADSDTIRLDYQMHPDNGGWRATDVLVDGSISRVAVQRSDFRGLLAAGDASALVNSLQQKIADLSGGSLA
jgi:phospholipid transport system substrate-binding protein